MLGDRVLLQSTAWTPPLDPPASTAQPSTGVRGGKHVAPPPAMCPLERLSLSCRLEGSSALSLPSKRSKFTTCLVVTYRTWPYQPSQENLAPLLLLAVKLLSRYHDRHHTQDLFWNLNLRKINCWKPEAQLIQ